MDWIIGQLIAFLTELRTMSLVSQVLTLAGVPSAIAFLFGIRVWLMTRKVRASVVAYDALEQRLRIAQREAAKLQAEVDRLEAETPAAFVARHAREMADENDERAMALAEDFVERQREALLLAFRARMDEAVRQSVEDGAPAFAAAHGWALAALALAPRDRTLRMLVDELAEAEAIAASGGRVKLKGDADREARAAREEWLPTDLAALSSAFFNARDRGHYALMLLLAGHGLTLTRRRPFGAGSKEHLLFRRHRAEALNLVGRQKEIMSRGMV